MSSFDKLNELFNMDNNMEDIDNIPSEKPVIEEEETEEEIVIKKKTKQKYNIDDIELMKTELQCKIERETQIAEDMRMGLKIGCPPRLYEVYAKIEQTISDDIMKLHDIEKTIAELQIVESKEEIQKQQMELRQKNALLKMEKANNKGPNQLIQNNTTINMTSSDLLNKLMEELPENANIITDENLLPKFNLN